MFALHDVERRARALEDLLVERGVVTPEFIDPIVEAYAQANGPMNGVKVVAHAWVEPDVHHGAPHLHHIRLSAGRSRCDHRPACSTPKVRRDIGF